MRELTRQEGSAGVSDLGWRYVFRGARTFVRVTSLAQAAAVAAQAAAAAGPDADEHLSILIDRDRVMLTVQTRAIASMTARDIEVVRRVTEAVRDLGLYTDAEVGEGARSVQVIELAIDALDIAAVRPFWKAVLGYHDETAQSGPEGSLADPVGQGPTIWFQQMDAPRPQRNRIHFDVVVPHDEAARRIEAAIDAGGTLRYDAEAPAFWVLADVEGNEACVCTWQGRDG